MAEPAQIAEPNPSKIRNVSLLVPSVPANALDTDAKPGINLQKSNADGPIRKYIFSVCLTQESGDNEIRQSLIITLLPYLRPQKYQKKSATTAATTAVNN